MKLYKSSLLGIPASFFVVSAAFACSCIAMTVEERYDRADVVFTGTVKEVREENLYNRKYVRFDVDTIWKGTYGEELWVYTPWDSAGCGVEFVKDKEYVVYSRRDEQGYLQTMLCDGTSEKQYADDDMDYLDTITPPQSCEPIECSNGTTHPSCTPSGNPIYYFADPCSVPQAQSFTDVPANHPYKTAIDFVKQQGIVEGYSDGSFRPEFRINRAEFAKIMTLAKYEDDDFDDCDDRIDESNDPTLYFKDNFVSAWYAPYVCLAKDKAIISGYPDGTFLPGNDITFAEAAKMLVRTFNIAQVQEQSGDLWWKAYVDVLWARNVLPSSYYHPAQLVTRAEMAYMIWAIQN